MSEHNIILTTDSYKETHYKMYPPDVKQVGSYFESRVGAEYKDTTFFGLQYLLQKYLSGKVVTQEKIQEAHEFCNEHFGQDVFNLDGWTYILEKYDGHLPVSINAVPEGTIVPESNVLFTIENTDPKCFWLTNHLETLLVQLWYPCTVATISREQKKVLNKGLEISGNTDNLPFMLHDFGYRGSTSKESAAIGGAAHLINFLGTDTLAAIELIKHYYEVSMAGFSVPAAEHSTITSWGPNGELEAYKHILDRYPYGIVSVVSDSYNIFDACERLWGTELREEVINNPSRKLVIRPDSGDPKTILVKVLHILAQQFGTKTNEKGYRILPDNIRIIQGDGITRKSLPEICDVIIQSKFSLDNVVFGSGGGLLQDCTRDTQRFALKCNWVKKSNGEIIDIFKNPKSDPTKASKAGQLKLVRGTDYTNNKSTLQTVNVNDPRPSIMREVFRNGVILTTDNLTTIRERASL